MAASIILRDEKRIVISNCAIARPINLGTWSTIRLGMRFCGRDNGTGASSYPRLAVGFCSGTTNIYGDATVTHFVGAITNGSAFSYYVGPPPYYSGGWSPGKKVGVTQTLGTGITLAGGTRLPIGPNYRGMLFVDLIKGSPNYTVRVFGPSSSSQDVDLTTFYTQLEVGAASHTGHSQGSSTVAVDEGANGTLDAINIAFDRTTPEWEISDVAVVRLA